MSGIDNRIVEMQFDNKQFENGIQTSTQSLKNLEKSLKLQDAGKGLDNLGKSALTNGVAVDALTRIADAVTSRFSIMGMIGVAALQNITNSAINAGKQMIRSLTIDPISAGFTKYEQKTASVQTIMNATGDSVEQVNGYLSRLMWFSDETSYGFTDMTAALAQMTSSGGQVGNLIPLITGVANATAYAGKGATEFSRAMYNINQSYGQGNLSAMDFKSLEQAGVASKELKQVFIDTGVALKKIKKGEVDVGNFSESLKKKWADTEVMEAAFGKFSELSEAAYTAVEAGEYETAGEAIQALAGKYSEVSQKAFKSAQSAKTFSEAVNATKDAVSTGWMKTAEIIFGNITVATDLWSKVTGMLWDIFASGAEGRNDFWAQALGTGDVVNGASKILNILNRLMEIGGLLKETLGGAFTEVFGSIKPIQVTEAIYGVIKSLQKFINWLKAANGENTRLEQIGKIFKGIFSIFKIGWTVVKAIGDAFWNVFKAVAPGAVDGLLTFFSGIGDSITEFANNLGTNKDFIAFFDGFGNVLSWFVKQAPGWWAAIVGFFSSDKAKAWYKSVTDFFDPVIKPIQEFIKKFRATFLGLFGIKDVGDTNGKTVMQQIQEKLGTPEGIQSVLDNVKALFAGWGDKIKVEFAKIKAYFKPLTDWIGKYVTIVKDFLSNLFGGVGETGGISIWEQFKGIFGSSKDIKELADGVIALVSKVWTDLKRKIIEIFTGKKSGLAGEKGFIGQLASGMMTDQGLKISKGEKGGFFSDLGGFFSGMFAFLGTIGKWFGGNWGWIAGAIGGIVVVKTLFSVLRIINVFGQIGKIFAKFKTAAPIKPSTIGKTALQIAGAIVLIVGAIYAITQLAKDADFDTALWVIGGIVGVLTLISFFGDKFGSTGKMGLGMLSIAASVVLIIYAIKEMMDLLDEVKDWKKLLPALAGIGLIMLGLIVVSKSSGGKGINGNWKSIIATAVAMWIIVKALRPLADMGDKQLEQMGKALLGLTLAIGSLMLISKIGGGVGKISGIIGLAVGIWLLVETLKPLAAINDIELERMGGILLAVSLMLSIFMRSAAKMQKGSGITTILSLIGLAGLIWVLSEALVKIKSVDTKKIKAFTYGLTALMVGFGSFLKASRKAGLKGVGAALLAIIGVIAIIALVAIAFSELSKNQGVKDFLNGGAEFLGELVGTFTGAMGAAELKSFSKGLEGFKDLTVDKASVQKAIDAGDLLADFSKSLPDKGIFQQIIDWLGGSKLAIFSRDIGLFGAGFSSFAASMANVVNIADLATKTTAAIDIAKSIVRFEEGLPPVSTTTRIISWLAGKSMTDLALFSADMGSFGTGFNAFSSAMAGINLLGIFGLQLKTGAAILIGESLSRFSAKLPPQSDITKITTWLSGGSTTNLGLFSKDMPNFAKGFSSFNTIMSEMPEVDAATLATQTTAAISIAQQLVNFEKGITGKDPITKFLSAWIISSGSTVTELGLLSTDMASFGVGFNGFATAMAGVLTTPEEASLLETKTKSAIAIAQALVNFENGIKDKSPITKALSAWLVKSAATVTELGLLSTDMASFGVGFNAYATAMGGVLTTTSEAGLLAGKTKSAILIAQSIADFSKVLPPVTGDNAIPILVWGSAIELNAKDMIALATAFSAFATGVFGISAPSGWEVKAATAVAIAKSIAEFAATLPPSTGDAVIPNWVWGTPVEKNSGDMAKFVSGFNTFATEIMKIELPPGFVDQVGTALDSVGKLKTFIAGLNANTDEWNVSTQQFDAIVTRLSSLAAVISWFNADTVTVDATRFNSIITSITGFVNAIVALSTTVTTDSIAIINGLIVELSGLLSTDLVAGVTTGIQNGAEGVVTQVTNLCTRAIGPVFAALGSFIRAGYFLASGLATGIISGTLIVVNAAKLVAGQAIKAANAALDNGSPSRVFEKIGMYTDMGFANGLLKYGTLVATASSSVATDSITAAKGVLTNFSTLLTNGVNTTPTIRPVVDLTDVTRGANTINGIFGADRSINVRGINTAPLAQRVAPITESTNANTNTDLLTYLGSRLDVLGQIMTGLKVVMNNGVVVGQLKSEIDRQLGVEAVNKGRR